MESKYIVIGVIVIAILIFVAVYYQTSKEPATPTYTQPGAKCKTDSDCTAPGKCGTGGDCVQPDILAAFTKAQTSANNVILEITTMQSNITQWATQCTAEDSAAKGSFFAANSAIFTTITNSFTASLSNYIKKSYYLSGMQSASTSSSPTQLLANINLQFDINDENDPLYCYTEFYNMVKSAYTSYGNTKLGNYNADLAAWYGQECTNISDAWTVFVGYVEQAQSDVNALQATWSIKST